jgi:hypothetical protein
MNWGKRYSKIYSLYQTESNVLNDKDMEIVVKKMRSLIEESKPLLDKIKWGRKFDKKIEEVEG